MDILKPVKKENAFILKNGMVLNSLADLKTVVGAIDTNIFSHHVNSERNDFSNWIRDVHQDNRLADSIGKAKTQSEVVSAITSRIKELADIKITHEKKSMKLINSTRNKRISTLKTRKASSFKSNKEEPIIIKLGNDTKKETITIVMDEDVELKTSNNKKIKTEKKYPLRMLSPRPSFRDNFIPFFKKNEINYEQFKLSDKNKKSRHKKEHHLDNVTNRQYMKVGAFDFFKGVLFGIIIGALLAASII